MLVPMVTKTKIVSTSRSFTLQPYPSLIYMMKHDIRRIIFLDAQMFKILTVYILSDLKHSGIYKNTNNIQRLAQNIPE